MSDIKTTTESVKNTIIENVEKATSGAEKIITHDVAYYWNIVEKWLIDFTPRLIGAVLVFWIGFKVANILARIFEKIFAGRGVDPTVEKFVIYLARILFKAMVLIAGVGVLGVQTSSFVALIAAAGFAIGTALSGSLSNFASGIIILIFRPYKIGDFVNIAGETGIVTDVTIFATKIRTINTRSVIIPNAKAISDRVINSSVYSERRLDIRLDVAYTDNIDTIRQIVVPILKNHPKIINDDEHKSELVVLSLSENAISLALRGWAKREDYSDLEFEILETVHQKFLENDFHFQWPSIFIAK